MKKGRIRNVFKRIINLLISPFAKFKIGRRLMIFTLFLITTIVLISSIIYLNTYKEQVMRDEEQKLRETLQLVNTTITQKKEEYKNYAGTIASIPEIKDILTGNGNDAILYELMSRLGISGLELRDSDLNSVSRIGLDIKIDQNTEETLETLMKQNISLGIYENNESDFQIYGISPIKNLYGIGAMGVVFVSQDIGGSIFRQLSESLDSGMQLYQGSELMSNSYNTFDDINLLDNFIIEIFNTDNSPEYYIQESVVNEISYMVGYVPIRGFSEEVVGYITIVSSLENAYNTITQVMIQTGILALIFILIASFMVYLITKSITIPLNNLVQATKRIAAGDLTQKLLGKSQDELGDLNKHFNTMIDNLNDIIVEISNSSNSILNMSTSLSANSEEVSAASQEVASASQGIADGVVEQVEQTDKTILILDNINDISKNVSNSSDDVKAAIDEAFSNSNYGLKVISGVSNRMNNILVEVNNTREEVSDLGDKIEEINDIIEAINYINEETSLLALNATIEAARAGEAGRGFAVVADEIRQLAEKTSESVQEISSIFKQINDAKTNVIDSMDKSNQLVTKGEEEVNNAQYVFSNIKEAVDNSRKAVDMISDMIKEQLAGTRDIGEVVNNINNIAASNAGGAQQAARVNEEQAEIIEDIATAADDLSSTANELERIVKRFVISRDNI